MRSEPDSELGPLEQEPCVVAGREQRGLTLGEQEDVGLDDGVRALAEAEDAQGHPRVRCRDREVDRRAVADRRATGRGGGAVEAGGHEDGAALGVEVEHLRRVGRQQEAVGTRPVADRPAAALEHRDVERVDLGVEQLTRRCGRLGGLNASETGVLHDRVHLAHQALQGPVAAPLDVGRHAGQRHDRAPLQVHPSRQLPEAPRQRRR